MTAEDRAAAIAEHGRQHERKITLRRAARNSAADRKKKRGLAAAVLAMRHAEESNAPKEEA